MGATIKDIAKRLNISVSTVSYALNGGPRQVREDVKEKVLETARELNYRPNRIARSMKTGKSGTLGVVPPEVVENVFLSPYLHLALNGIINEAGRLHQDVLLFTRCNETDSDELVSILGDGRVDGVIFIAPHFSEKAVELALSLHSPCVTVAGVPLDGVLTFSVDNELGVDLAMKHLYDLGHRRIGHIAGRLDMQDSILRLQGYQKFLRSKRLSYREEMVTMGQFTIEGGRAAMRQLLSLDEPPTAVFCANDEMALGALMEAQSAGVKVPDELSIVGFDSTPGSANVFPSLTTVEQPIGALGAAAVRAIVQMIDHQEPDEEPIFIPNLIVRESTSSPAVKAK
ncbi:LacI family DNA-binding transcriptional regulator [Kamptonema cortianum]|nr:LacI family DNA-binding transcriptional regulator [Geitlerinema splendidum]MDK3158447.1 LacI family DNA-binding transcriptional regulator [Kamptonema cortianum]